MDLCGRISPASRGVNHYIFQRIDGHSHMRFMYLLSAKLECFEYFIKFQKLVQNLKVRTIKTVVSDNGGKFVNSKLKNLFDIKGICHLPKALYTPQRNPIAERGNQSLLEQIQVMMQHNSVPSEWWGEASAMAAFLLNRTPVVTLNFVAVLTILNSPKARRKSKINPKGTLSKDNNPLPKGWVYDNIQSKAPSDVDSSISGGQLCKPPNLLAGTVINRTPHTFKEAMASSKSDAWMVAIQNKFSSLGRHGVLEEVKPWEGL
ncbi:hypothetical protein O181_034626 [Austropuccinia psidii MF-1]|uniref:Integrase catalytic domain-containing protein n=1 Tax=Austropuccinia psidii MF-1 TaxID=1389203 RepID=A0A9Q3D129_9BASI|nr:hypothetical protein [Austropuccinia psidii MF-1]